MKPLSNKTCLLIIDLQQAIDDPSWGVRNNPQAENVIAKLLAFWRLHQLPLIHVKHMSTEAGSTYRPDQPGNQFKPVAQPLPTEFVLEKQVQSAFIGTDLEARLQQAGISELVIVGVITNNSVEATARNAGNLGFYTIVVSDGTFTFGRQDYNGNYHDAETIHAISLANMDGEYATICDSESVLTSLSL